MDLINNEAIIDSLIKDFPGNRALQKKLGLEITDAPYESLTDAPWSQPDLLGFARYLIDHGPIKVNPTETEKQIKKLENDFIKVMNRMLMMDMIVDSNYRCNSDNTISDLLIIYINIVLPDYYTKIEEIVRSLVDLISSDLEARVRLQNILER